MIDHDATIPATAAARATPRAFGTGDVAAGRYRIERFIAAGAMGEVYAAHDLVVGETVALKALRSELAGSADAVERLRREIALARKVTNVHVCRLHDVGEHAGRVFLTMELLDGITLAERVRAHGSLSIDEIEHLSAQLVDGLTALHAAGIVHRDFKTANVLLVGERAVITDFGLARSVDGGDAVLTAEATLLGTPAYMAPEQVEGRAATPASDIYAFGVVLFELLTGQVPFREDTALATATARLHKDPPRLATLRNDVPVRWVAIVERCLEREPTARFARIDDVLAGTRRRRRWLWPAVVGAGVAATAASLIATRVLGTQPDELACPTAARKLAHVWDAESRAALARRYEVGTKPFVAAMWQLHSRQLDEAVAVWKPRWDAACASADRAADPLLYGQRLTCLDGVLTDMKSYIGGLANPSVSVEDMARASPGEYPIDPASLCDDPLLLRAQLPLPPPEHRAAVDVLLAEGNALRAQIRLGPIGGVTIDQRPFFDRLAVIEQRLIELGAPADAGWLRYYRTLFLADAGEIDEASAASASLIELAEQVRDDHLLVSGLMQQLFLQAAYLANYDVAAGEAALVRAATVAKRIGNPTTLRNDIAEAERVHARRSGLPDRLRHALTTMAESSIELGRPSWASGSRAELADLDDDVAAAHAILDESIKRLGPANLNLAHDYLDLAPVLARNGEPDQALALARRAIEVIEAAQGNAPSTQLFHAHAVATGIATQLGRSEDAARHARAAVASAVARGKPVLGAYADLVAALADVGQLAAARAVVVLGRAVTGTDADRAALGDADLRMRIDAGEFRELRQLPASYAAEPLVRARVLVAAKRYSEAIDAVRDIGDPADRRARRSVHALLGIALVEVGRFEESIAHLERAVMNRTALSYAARDALARALRATNGDRARAQRLDAQVKAFQQP